jgi:hypothetical protein
MTTDEVVQVAMAHQAATVVAMTDPRNDLSFPDEASGST